MARIQYIPNRVIDTNGISDGAAVYVYQSGTNTLVSLYYDPELTVPILNPMVVPAGAEIPVFYHNFSGEVRLRVVADDGSVPMDDDPYIPPLSHDDLEDAAGEVAFVPGGGYAPNTVGGKLQEAPTWIDNHGSIATPASTAAALAASITYRNATGAALELAKDYAVPTSGGPYTLGPGPIFARPGASFTGRIYFGSDIAVQGRVPFRYNDGSVYFDYTLGRKWKRPLEERERPLDAVTDDNLRLEAVDMSTLETTYWNATSSDTWTSESPTKTAAQISYALANDSLWHVTWVPVMGGMDVTAAMSGAISGSIFGVFVRTTGGFEYFYAGTGLPGNLGIKLAGAAPSVTGGFSWLGQGTHESFAFHKSLLTVRALQGRKYAVMLNGTEIFPVRDMPNPGFLSAAGEIVAIGFGVFGNNTATVSIDNITRRTTREATGACPLHIGITGNSISDPNTHGAWDAWMREALDGAMGLKVLSVTNLAVSGYNSAQILNSVSGGALGQSNVCLIVSPEVNDVQGGASVTTTLGNISPMIDDLLAAGRKPILVTGPLWYSQALASGQGLPTTNYAEGAPHRAALRRLAATKGAGFFDLSEITGPVLSTYLATPNVTDAIQRDNIHPTAWFYRRIGEWMAKAILRAFRPKMTPRVRDAAFPTGAYSWMGNGWGINTAAYSLGEEGDLSFDAIFTAGTKTDGTPILNIPPAYRPTGNRYASVSSDVPGNVPLLQCQPDGNCVIYGLDPTATFIRVAARWTTALAA